MTGLKLLADKVDARNAVTRSGRARGEHRHFRRAVLRVRRSARVCWRMALRLRDRGRECRGRVACNRRSRCRAACTSPKQYPARPRCSISGQFSATDPRWPTRLPTACIRLKWPRCAAGAWHSWHTSRRAPGHRRNVLSPTITLTILGIIGTLASLAGNEAAIHFGRRLLISAAMVGSVAFAALLAVFGVQSYPLAVALMLFYGFAIWLDSSSLTAGTAGTAEPSRRGATLAVHSSLGYLGGFIGPLAVGWVLDLSGGNTLAAWSAAFTRSRQSWRDRLCLRGNAAARACR